MQIIVELLHFHVVSDRNDFGLLEPVLCFLGGGFFATFNLHYDYKIITHPPR